MVMAEVRKKLEEDSGWPRLWIECRTGRNETVGDQGKGKSTCTAGKLTERADENRPERPQKKARGEKELTYGTDSPRQLAERIRRKFNLN